MNKLLLIPVCFATVAALVFSISCSGSESKASSVQTNENQSATPSVGIASPPTPTLVPSFAAATTKALIPNPLSIKSNVDIDPITPEEAKSNIGKNIKVCGKVEEIRQEKEIKEDPYLLNFDSFHPEVLFFALVRSAFQYRVGDWPSNPETYYLGKNVCASGVIQVWRGIPFITAGHSYQLEVVE